MRAWMWHNSSKKISEIHVFCNNDKSKNHNSDHYTSYKMEIPIYRSKQHFLLPATTWRFTKIM